MSGGKPQAIPSSHRWFWVLRVLLLFGFSVRIDLRLVGTTAQSLCTQCLPPASLWPLMEPFVHPAAWVPFSSSAAVCCGMGRGRVASVHLCSCPPVAYSQCGGGLGQGNTHS